MLIMDFALVAEETAGVGEALDFVAAGFEADVGAGVFIHVFCPFTLASKSWGSGRALGMDTCHLV